MQLMAHIFALIAFLVLSSVPPIASLANHVGVCYGRLGDNLPSPSQVLALLDGCHINEFRLYEPQQDVMEALKQYPDKRVSVGVRNEDLPKFATRESEAKAWVDKNYSPYASYIMDIVVGNEVLPGDNGQYLVPAMINLRKALVDSGHDGAIVTTALSTEVLIDTYPPSKTVFNTARIGSAMQDLVEFINTLPQRKLYIHLYPYFALDGNRQQVSKEYALFQSKGPVVHDNGLEYYNLFDSMYDGFAWAMEKIGGNGIQLVVGETGWPSEGKDVFTTPDLAGIYNSNVFKHLAYGNRTPKVSGLGGGFIFALFNENKKNGEAREQHFGLFYPNMTQVYATPICSADG